MPSGPSRRLEGFVGSLIPPACREEVLGDLHEKYTGPWQYISLAMCVIPCVMLSRIRRTTDPLILLTEALLIYGSFLAATWYTDKTLLSDPWGMLRLVIPTVLNLAAQILQNAWGVRATPGPVIPILGCAISISLGFSKYGTCASLLLVSAVEILFHTRANLPQGAGGGPALSLKQRSGSAVIPMGTKFSIAVAAVITLEGVVQALTGVRPGVVGALIIFVVLATILLDKPRKD